MSRIKDVLMDIKIEFYKRFKREPSEDEVQVIYKLHVEALSSGRFMLHEIVRKIAYSDAATRAP